MQIKAGLVLKATTALNGTFFEQAKILLTTCNEEGAIGFVFNKSFDRNLQELVEFRDCAAVPLYEGGPVDPEHIYFIHRRPDLVEEGERVAEDIYMAGNFQQALNGINNQEITSNQIKLFIGYCGWDAGDLEAEIAEGSWELEEPVMAEVFG